MSSVARIGVLGFSAGGHVAASLATRHAAKVYAPVDDADARDAKPAFAGVRAKEGVVMALSMLLVLLFALPFIAAPVVEAADAAAKSLF